MTKSKLFYFVFLESERANSEKSKHGFTSIHLVAGQRTCPQCMDNTTINLLQTAKSCTSFRVKAGILEMDPI